MGGDIPQPSYVMIDKLATVCRSNVQERIGHLPTAQLVDVECDLMAFLGLAA